MTFKLWSNSSDSSKQWEKLKGNNYTDFSSSVRGRRIVARVYEAKSRQFRDRFNRVTGGEGRLKRRSSLDTQGAQLPTKMDVEAKEER